MLLLKQGDLLVLKWEKRDTSFSSKEEEKEKDLFLRDKRQQIMLLANNVSESSTQMGMFSQMMY